MRSRRISQFLSLLALHSSWGPEVKWLCNPVLSCHSCVLAWFACPVGVLTHYADYRVFPFLAMGMVLLLGILVGRLLCGWVCPFGFVQDLLHMLPTRKFTLPSWMGKLKYLVLALFVILFPAFLGSDTFLSFCRICPASALQVTIPNQIASHGSDLSVPIIVKLSALALILILAMFSSRFFCKVLCPIGAILAPLNVLSFWRIKPPTDQCVSCRRCDKVCPVDGEPSTRIEQNIAPNTASECIVCHECQQVCPHNGKERGGFDLDKDDEEEWGSAARAAERVLTHKE